MNPDGLPYHVPVMAAEVLALLHPQPGQVILDCTLGGGGHAALIAERLSPSGRLIGLDQDPDALNEAEKILARFGSIISSAVKPALMRSRPGAG